MVSYITEKQFNMLHDLLNLCDEKQIPREMQFIIAKNLQSSLYMERDIEEIKNEVLSDSVPFARENPCKICLFTDGEVYGPMPEENEPLLQRISLTDKGNVTVTFYNYEKKKLSMKKFRVDAARSLAVIRDIAYHFACEPAHLRAYDVGSWDLTVTTDRGEKYDFCGDLLEDAVQNTLSDKLRDLLNDPTLLCFDGRDGKKESTGSAFAGSNRAIKNIPIVRIISIFTSAMLSSSRLVITAERLLQQLRILNIWTRTNSLFHSTKSSLSKEH